MKKSCVLLPFFALFLALSVSLNVYFLVDRRAAHKKNSAPENNVETASPQEVASPVKPVDSKQHDKPAFKLLSLDVSRKTGGTPEVAVAEVNAWFSGDLGLLNIGKDDLQISPEPVEISGIRVAGNSVSISAKFRYHVNYIVDLKKTEHEMERNTGAAFPFVINVKPPEPRVRFTASGPYYPVPVENRSGKSWKMWITAVNTPKVEFKLWRMDENNIDISGELSGYYWDESALEKRLMSFVSSKTVELDLQENVESTAEVELADLLGGDDKGIYMVSAGAPREHGEWRPVSETMVILSDLGISATVSADAGTAAVTVFSLWSMNPVSGATVVLTSLKRKILGRGTTGGDGTVLLSYPVNILDDDDRPHTVTVKKGGDISFLRLKEGLDTAEFSNTGKMFPGKHRVFLFTERGIYRPGETVNISLFQREAAGASLKVSKSPCEATVTGPDGTLLEKKRIVPGIYGFSTFSLKIPEGAIPGVYTVKCGLGNEVWNTCTFMAGTFTPDRIKVELKAERDICGISEAVRFKFNAAYYFGQALGSEAAAGGALYGRLKKAAHWKNYAVGPEDSGRELVRMATAGTKSFSSYDGNMAFPSLEILTRDNTSIPREFLDFPVELTLEASVSEPGLNAVTASSSVICIPTGAFLGLRAVDSAGKTARIECRLLNYEPEDTTGTDGKIRFELVKKEWEYLLTENGGSKKMEWVLTEKPAVRLPDLTVNEGTGVLEIPELDDGMYRISGYYGNQKTQLNFWHWQGEKATVRSGNPNILAATCDKDSYLPGEVAAISFDSSGSGLCMVSAGEQGLRFSRTYQVTAGRNTILLPVPKDIFTGKLFVHLSLAVKDNKDYQRSFALMKINLNQEASRINVALDMQKTAEPGEKIKIKVRTANQNGEGVPAAVQIFAVDEGLLSLTGYETPDIFEYFHGAYYCGYSTYDVLGSIFPDLSIRSSGKTGGDGSARRVRLPKLRQSASAVLILPLVDVPASGDAEVEAVLPEHLGAMRFMAVAAGDSLVGSADCLLKMREEMSVMPALPAAVARGDSFTASFHCFNNTTETVKTAFSVELPENLTGEGGNAGSVFELPAGGRHTVSVKLKAVGYGEGTITAVLSAGSRKFTGKTTVTVRPPVPYSERSEFCELKPGEILEWTVNKGDWHEITAAGVQVSVFPGLSAVAALDWLNQYPHGCLEQTVSKAFPFLYAENLAKAGLADRRSLAKSAEAKITDAVIQVLGMQRGSRGFAPWSDSNEIWDDVSVYAVHFLAKSGKKHISPGAVKNMELFLLQKLAQKNMNLSAELTAKSYALYVLSLLNRGGGIKMRAASLLEYPGLDGMGRFFAGAALVQADYAREGMELMKQALDSRCWETENVPWFLNSPVVRTAMVLAVSMEYLPSYEAGFLMVESLNRLSSEKGGWGSTRDNSWACMGLAAYSAAHEYGKGELALVTDGKSTTCTVEDAMSLPLEAGEKHSLRNTGECSLFIRRRVAGVPATPLEVPNAKITLSKSYLNSGGGEVSTVSAGELVTVKLVFSSEVRIKDLLLTDVIPGGFQIEDGTLATRAKNGAAVTLNNNQRIARPQRTEAHEDRFFIFGSMEAGVEYVYTFNLRAVTPGDFLIPSAYAEDMYDTGKTGIYLGGGRFSILQ